jgi:alpha-methylacyl-CoA racemase
MVRRRIPGATVADAAAGGMQAALAITTALAGRATTGVGAYLDVSVAEGVLWLMSLPSTSSWRSARHRGRVTTFFPGRYACYGTYETRDGKWVAVGAIEAKFFANLCQGLGCPELAGEQLDDAAQPAIRAAFAAAFATRTGTSGSSCSGRLTPASRPFLMIADVARTPSSPPAAWSPGGPSDRGLPAPAGPVAGRHGSARGAGVAARS